MARGRSFRRGWVTPSRHLAVSANPFSTDFDKPRIGTLRFQKLQVLTLMSDNIDRHVY